MADLEKIILRFKKKGFTATQLESAARAFAAQRGLTYDNYLLYHDFEEMAVFCKNSAGEETELTLPFGQLFRWLK